MQLNNTPMHAGALHVLIDGKENILLDRDIFIYAGFVIVNAPADQTGKKPTWYNLQTVTRIEEVEPIRNSKPMKVSII